MTKMVPLAEAVGMVLPHDVTEIRQGEFKGRAFRKGHIIREEDLDRLRNLGKEHIYILELGPEEIHENEAAELLAAALVGPGVEYGNEAVEGKINLVAAHNGILRIKVEALAQVNLQGDVMCATLHDYTPVTKGLIVAGTRLIPLVGQRSMVESTANCARQAGGVISVSALPSLKVGLLITGNEVFNGRIQDRFEPVLREKLADLGSKVIGVRFAPDDVAIIAGELGNLIDEGAELLVTSGGMSVDPDDVTRQGIIEAGATDIVYGTPVLPGAMFLIGKISGVPILGLPACGMFHRITVFDLLLPRVLLGETITREEIARMGHGGLCRQCTSCRYPICDFGR
ncbi:MAG: molybdopterin-binding protein [Proteobacteria bacterium]|nr:molybdopterin-binding protein [Pseudomonadota bacterium]MBU1688038.1 molybdopterin-binding protein [Pseudomonadota bacterium]